MKFWAILIGILITKSVLGQELEHAWIYFKDKPNAETFIASPNLMLTQRAINRRIQQNININSTDVPLENTYVEQVSNSIGITVKAKSKWMNALHIIGTQANINALLSLSFVSHIEFANKSIGVILPNQSKQNNFNRKKENLNTLNNFNYGTAQNQTEMLNLDFIHGLGYDGLGYQIAIMDGGFFGVNTAGAFSHLHDNDNLNGEILGGYDYVNKLTNYYTQTGTTHGTQVLSTIGAIKENDFVGTAPKASYYLFVTEDSNSETPLEESLWVQAAEKADSLGIDIINTSLGYNEFDEPKYNYTYEDMDGQTTFISRGAKLAADKGIVVVNSIGNSGHTEWKYITAPADADGVISVGAVDANQNISFFSSFGPTYDGRIKPETLAQGENTYVVDENNVVKTTNGTSFSGPIIAGTVACLWQAFPDMTSAQIRQLVIENSNQYNNPTEQRGYGVLKLDSLTQNSLSKDPVAVFNCCTYNQSDKILTFTFNNPFFTPFIVSVYDGMGSLKFRKEITFTQNTLDLRILLSGVYVLNYTCCNVKRSQKIIIN